MAILDFVWMLRSDCEYNEYDPILSAIKDVCYATADVSTKAGMALIAFLLATR